MKKILKISALFLALTTLFCSLVACNNNDEKPVEEDTTNVDYLEDNVYENEGNGIATVLGEVTLTDFAARIAECAPSFTVSLDKFQRTSKEGAKEDEYSLLLYSEGIKLFALKTTVDPATQYVKSCNIGGFSIGSKDGKVYSGRKALYKQVSIAVVRAFTGKSSKQSLDVYLAFDLNNDSNFLDVEQTSKTIDGCVYSYSSKATSVLTVNSLSLKVA